MFSLCLVVVVMLICFEPVFSNFLFVCVQFVLICCLVLLICFEPVLSNFCLTLCL